MQSVPREWLDFLRQQFPKDSRIQLTEIGGNHRPISPGSTGKLDYIDDAGQFHVKWDNGCTLALVLGEDRFSVYLPEPQTFKLYMPLTADFYGRDEWGDMSEDGEEWDGRTLMDYEGQILSALVKNRVPEENESGLMRWYGEDDSVDHKVRSAVFTVEVRNRQLWGVAECRVAGELTPEELTILKEYLGGQASDGWGEGFEQRPIEVDGGELYVHLWQPDDWSIQTEQERFAPKVAEGLPELCFSTLRTTGQLICIKRGETGYYPSDWDTGDKEGNVELADELNEDLGVTPIQRQAMEIGSMAGWDVPGADPKHYEESYSGQTSYETYDYSNLDVYSRMYPALSEIQEYLDKDGSKPFLLVEYCHSMGNGPGDFEDYFQMIQDNDKMCGGFVWEWCDHAIAHGTAENGKTIYAYGGDHGEEIHDGNFCMDGLVYPDRTVHTGLLEYKNVYRPARVISYNKESGELVLHNYMDFDDLKDYVKISYELTQDGLVISKGILPEFSVAPHGEGKTNLKINVPENGKCYLKLIYHLKKELPLLDEDHILGFDEIEVSKEDTKCKLAEKWIPKTVVDSELQVNENDTQIHIKGREFAYTIDKRTALFTEMKFAGREYLNHPMELNIWRAPTDNDMYIKSEWKKAHYDKAYTRAYTTEVVQGKHGVKITSHASVVAETVQKILDVTITWKIEAAGKIDADIAVTKDDEFPDLPRFGVRMFLDKKLSAVRYFGMGPQESYCDKHQAASHGLYQANVDDLHEDYIRPQENGSHYDCEYVELNNSRYGIVASAEKAFSFNASYYTQEELEKKTHNYELIESDSVVFCVDYALNGIGSNSCGPVVLEQYRFDDVLFRFQFTLIPYVKG